MYKISPFPMYDPPDSYTWKDWFRLLREIVLTLYREFSRTNTITPISGSTALTDANGTVIITQSGITVTLPAASPERIGKIWIINFSTTGTLTIQRAGSDTIMTDYSATDTSVIVTVRGTSLCFQCASASTWIIV